MKSSTPQSIGFPIGSKLSQLNYNEYCIVPSFIGRMQPFTIKGYKRTIKHWD